MLGQDVSICPLVGLLMETLMNIELYMEAPPVLVAPVVHQYLSSISNIKHTSEFVGKCVVPVKCLDLGRCSFTIDQSFLLELSASLCLQLRPSFALNW